MYFKLPSYSVDKPYPLKFKSSRLVCVKECHQYNGCGRNWRLLANQNDPKMGWVDRSTAESKAKRNLKLRKYRQKINDCIVTGNTGNRSMIV